MCLTLKETYGFLNRESLDLQAPKTYGFRMLSNLRFDTANMLCLHASFSGLAKIQRIFAVMKLKIFINVKIENFDSVRGM